MRKSLTSNDIKKLRNRCSMGYLIATILFIVGTIVGITIYESNFDVDPGLINHKMALTIGVSSFLFSFVVFFGLNWKYYSDIRNNEKIQLIKMLQNKDKTTYYYRNTITVNYNLIVDNINLTVDKELFDNCSKGDKLLFNYAPKSNYLLGIEKMRKI